jgi:hypothetical protein
MPLGRQLKALVRKNYIIKKRLWKQTIWEFIIPIFFSVLLSFSRHIDEP